MPDAEVTQEERVVISCLIHLLEAGTKMTTAVTDPSDKMTAIAAALQDLLDDVKDEGEGEPC